LGSALDTFKDFTVGTGILYLFVSPLQCHTVNEPEHSGGHIILKRIYGASRCQEPCQRGAFKDQVRGSAIYLHPTNTHENDRKKLFWPSFLRVSMKACTFSSPDKGLCASFEMGAVQMFVVWSFCPHREHSTYPLWECGHLAEPPMHGQLVPRMG
jgi:hypothetical protein